MGVPLQEEPPELTFLASNYGQSSDGTCGLLKPNPQRVHVLRLLNSVGSAEIYKIENYATPCCLLAPPPGILVYADASISIFKPDSYIYSTFCGLSGTRSDHSYSNLAYYRFDKPLLSQKRAFALPEES